jgi:hypothetical protein
MQKFIIRRWSAARARFSTYIAILDVSSLCITESLIGLLSRIKAMFNRDRDPWMLFCPMQSKLEQDGGDEALRGPCDSMDDNNSSHVISRELIDILSCSAYSRPPLLFIPAWIMAAISMYTRACSSIVLGSTDEPTIPLQALLLSCISFMGPHLAVGRGDKHAYPFVCTLLSIV